MRVKSYNSAKELEDALNLWADFVPNPEILVQGGLFYITNLPDLGEQLLINPNFEDGETGWTLGDGWSFQGNRMYCDGSQVAQTNLLQNGAVEDGKTYLVEACLSSIDDGIATLNIGGASASPQMTEVKIHRFIIDEGGGTEAFYCTASVTFIGSFNYFSVREILE